MTRAMETPTASAATDHGADGRNLVSCFRSLLPSRLPRSSPSLAHTPSSCHPSATSSPSQDLPPSRLTALVPRREAFPPGRKLSLASAGASPPRLGRPLSAPAKLPGCPSRFMEDAFQLCPLPILALWTPKDPQVADCGRSRVRLTPRERW